MAIKPTELERPSTPPAHLRSEIWQLPSPPLTGGSIKQVRFANDVKKQDFSQYVGFVATKDTAPKELAEMCQSGDDDGKAPVSEDKTKIAQNVVPVSDDLESCGLMPDRETIDALVYFGGSKQDFWTIESFPFMTLPLIVRKLVYGVLLVIPALICVRQNHTPYHREKRAYLSVERRELLSGIAYALPQVSVDGFKFRFARFHSVNAAILCVSKEVHAEAKAVMYGANHFELRCPNIETDPTPDFKVPLFPRGYPRLIRRLVIRVHAFYPLRWLLCGGYVQLKNAYRGLDTLTIVLEMEHATKGFGKRLTRVPDEDWATYMQRLRSVLGAELFDPNGKRISVPSWMHLRVLFTGEKYETLRYAYDKCALPTTDPTVQPVTAAGQADEHAHRRVIQCGLFEAFESFHKGTRQADRSRVQPLPYRKHLNHSLGTVKAAE